MLIHRISRAGSIVYEGLELLVHTADLTGLHLSGYIGRVGIDIKIGKEGVTADQRELF